MHKNYLTLFFLLCLITAQQCKRSDIALFAKTWALYAYAPAGNEEVIEEGNDALMILRKDKTFEERFRSVNVGAGTWDVENDAQQFILVLRFTHGELEGMEERLFIQEIRESTLIMSDDALSIVEVYKALDE